MNIERKYILLEKTIDGKKWIRKQFKNHREMLKYKQAKRLAQLTEGALRNQGFFLIFIN